MDDKLLDMLLEMVAQRRPSWGRIAAQLRIHNVKFVRGVKPGHQSSKELKLRIEMLDLDRQIAWLKDSLSKKDKLLSKPKAVKANPVAKKKAKA